MNSTKSMTIEAAAESLNVSVDYVCKLLEEGKLASLTSEDVSSYKLVQDEQSKAALDELAALGQEMGNYD